MGVARGGDAVDAAVPAARLHAAKELVLSWYLKIEITGAYIEPGIRTRLTRVEGDLTQIPTFWEGGIGRDGGLGSGAWLHHTKPNPRLLGDPSSNAVAKNTIDYLLWKGLSRSRDSALAALDACIHKDDLEPLLAAIKRVLAAFEDFHGQVTDTFSRGPSQLYATDDEYGPETNFWVKLRSYLSCQNEKRRGPEVGGSKFWCNSMSLPTHERRPFVLSAGSGGDFAYEALVATVWPRGATTVTLDCTTLEEASSKALGENSTLVMLPICLTGEDERYTIGVHETLRPKFLTWEAMVKEARAYIGESFDHFDVLKVNIEGFEYPLFANVFERPDQNLKGVSHVHLELHRMGMHEFGLSWPSLVFMEMLLAHFFSGGYVPFATEKWHDSSAASDVAFVNQSYYLKSEVDASRALREELDACEGAAEAAAEAAAATTTEEKAAEAAEAARFVTFPPGTLTKEECAALVAGAERAGFAEVADPVDRVAKPVLHLYYCPDETGRHAPCEGFNPRFGAQEEEEIDVVDDDDDDERDRQPEGHGGQEDQAEPLVALVRRVKARFEAEVARVYGEEGVRVYWVYVNRFAPHDPKPGLRMHTDSCDFTGNLLLSEPPPTPPSDKEGETGSGGGGGGRSGGGEFFLLGSRASAAVAPLLDVAHDKGESMAARNARVDDLAAGLAASGELGRRTVALEAGAGVAHPGHWVHGVRDVTGGHVRYSLILFANRPGVITVATLD